jgi:hypothetical protein
MQVAPNSTDVTTYWKLTDPATGVPVTGLTITDLDITYTRDRAAVVKADLTALALVDSVHADNKAIEVDATNAPGMYRVDFPDAAFAAGVARVQLGVNGAAIDPAVIECELSPWLKAVTGATVNADVTHVNGVAQTATLDTIKADAVTILARLGAWTGTTTNTILGALRALMNKAIAAPSDITSGGTYDASTDSLEGIRDTAPLGTAMRGTDAAMLAASYVAPPAVATMVDAVWDEVLHVDHEVASSASVLLQSAGGAADPLQNAVPGAYAAGSAGYVLGHMGNSAAITVTTALSGSTINITRGDYVEVAIAGLGSLVGHVKLWITAKGGYNDTDAQSIFQVEHTAGLLYLNGAPALTATDASLAISVEASGDVLLVLKAALTAALSPLNGALWDCQWLDGSGHIHTLATGQCNVLGSLDITRAIT